MLALYLLIALYVGNKLPFWIAKVVTFFQRRAILNPMLPKKLNPKKLCSGSHNWLPANIYTDQGSKEIKVCNICGFIMGTETVATPEAIDIIEENLRHKEIEDRIYMEFSTREDSDIRKFFSEEIKNGLSFEKLQKLHNAGITYNHRYVVFRSAKNKEVQLELAKSNA
jgi:hypothetical protein